MSAQLDVEKPYFDPREAPVAAPPAGPTVFYRLRADAEATLRLKADQIRAGGR